MIEMSQAARIQALSIGHALNAGPAGSGIVHSVFECAANLVIGEEMWTLLTAEKRDLPFGIRVASRDLDRLRLRRSEPVNARAGFVSIGSGSACRVVDCRAAPRWLPGQPNRIEPGLGDRLAVVSAVASDRSWRKSARMAEAVRSTLGSPVSLGEALVEVVGSGPGLTPSGDDVLVGILAVLNSPVSGAAGITSAELLGRTILPLLPTTGEISGQLLRQAVKGLFSRSVHELMVALLGNPSLSRLRNAIRSVVETGATSGADTCMGLLAVAPSFFTAGEERTAALTLPFQARSYESPFKILPQLI